MTRKVLIEFLVLVLVAGAIWAVFYFFPVFPDTKLADFPVEQEEKLGKRLVESLIETQTVVASPPLDSAVQTTFKRLMEALGKTEFDYKIIVLSNEQINAFALPGGNIVVFSGLITFADSPEEFAAVLAHEMGHVENRDVITRLMKELGVSILLSGLGGNDGVLLGEITKSAISTSFDRRQEENADQRGMDLLAKAGISPRVVASFFRRLGDKGLFSKQLEMLSTHPHNNSRIKAALEYPLPADFQSRPMMIDWSRVKATLKEPAAAQN